MTNEERRATELFRGIGLNFEEAFERLCRIEEFLSMDSGEVINLKGIMIHLKNFSEIVKGCQSLKNIEAWVSWRDYFNDVIAKVEIKVDRVGFELSTLRTTVEQEIAASRKYQEDVRASFQRVEDTLNRGGDAYTELARRIVLLEEITGGWRKEEPDTRIHQRRLNIGGMTEEDGA